jgi:hypothetical protein
MGSKTASSAGIMNGPEYRHSGLSVTRAGYPTKPDGQPSNPFERAVIRTLAPHRTSTCHREFYGTFKTSLLIVRALVSTVGRMRAETRRVE